MILQGTFKDKRGLTLIELLIVIAIMFLLVTVATPIYGNLQVSSTLNDFSDRVVQTVRTAQVRSKAGLNEIQHGVYFNIDPLGPDSFTLFQGNDYASRDTDYDRTESFGEGVSVSTDLGGSQVIFSRNLGFPSSTGLITITHDVEGERILEISKYGLIEEK